MPSGHPCILTIAGERKSVAEWAIIAGIPKVTILARLRRGISASLAVFGEAAQTKPKRGRPKAKPAPAAPMVLNRWGGVVSITFRSAA